MKQFIYLLAVVVLASCSDTYADFTVISEKKEIDYEIDEVQLTGENLVSDNLYGLIRDIRYNNNSLYILDGSSDNVISKLDLKSNKLIPLITKGEGPNEIDNGVTVKINKVENGIVEYHEFYSPFINYVDEQKPNLVIEGSKVPDEYISAQSTVDINGSAMGVVGTQVSSSFSIINNGQDNVIDLPDYLDYGRDLSMEERSIAMPKNIGQMDDFLFFWRNQFNTLELFSLDGKLSKTYRFGKNENITKDGLIRKFTYYFDAKAENQYIYAMYAGFNTIDDFTEDLIPTLKTEVHIFNTETDEIVRFKFDRLINYCTIDFEHNIIYAVEENNENYPIVKYKFDLDI